MRIAKCRVLILFPYMLWNENHCAVIGNVTRLLALTLSCRAKKPRRSPGGVFCWVVSAALTWQVSVAQGRMLYCRSRVTMVAGFSARGAAMVLSMGCTRLRPI